MVLDFDNFSIALIILNMVFIVATLYFFVSYKKLLCAFRKQEELSQDMLQKQQNLEFLSNELAEQMELEISNRIKSDVAYNNLFNTSLNPVLVVSNDDLKIEKCNMASVGLFGRELVGFNLLELFADKEQKKIIFNEVNQIKNDGIRRFFKLSLTIDNNEILLLVSIHMFVFAQKSALYVLLVDISDMAKLEQELQRSRIMLNQKSKMEKVGEMMANIAHQWKQPLNSLYLLSQNLKESNELDELDRDSLEKYIKIMQEQISFMSRTIDEFREFYNPSKSEEVFDVNKVTRNAIELFYKLIDKRIVIKVEKNTRHSLKIYASKNEFQQILIALLDNSIDAITSKLEDGSIKTGHISIKFSLEENLAGNKMCVMKIKDNGGGIDSSIANSVFESYFTTKVSGSGIGLAIVGEIIKKLDGRISFLNDKGGVEFKIELPLYLK